MKVKRTIVDDEKCIIYVWTNDVCLDKFILDLAVVQSLIMILRLAQDFLMQLYQLHSIDRVWYAVA